MSSIFENVLLVFDNLVIDIKKDVIHIQNYVFHFKIMSIIFLNVFFILHNLVIGMHAILIAFFVVVCMRQTSFLNLKWTRKYLSEKNYVHLKYNGKIIVLRTRNAFIFLRRNADIENKYLFIFI